MDLSIQRIHKRGTRPSTKLGNNTFGRITWRSSDNRNFEAAIRYHNTDIITVWYVQPDPDDFENLQVLYAHVNTEGWHTTTTTTRINAFFRDNGLPYQMFISRGDVFVLSDDDKVRAGQDRKDNKIASLRKAYQQYNLYSMDDFQAVVLP